MLTLTVKMAAGFLLLSLSREPADSLEEICSEVAGRAGLLKRQEFALLVEGAGVWLHLV